MALGFPVVPEEKRIQIGAEKSTGVKESSFRLLVLFSKTSYSSRLTDSNKGKIIAELNINPELWFFDCHFKEDPVMPGCLGLDAMWQLLGFFLLWSGLSGVGRALGAEKVKFFGQVLPTAKIVRYELDIKRIINRGAVLGLAHGKMYVDDREVYSAENLKVGLFKDTSNF